MAQRRFHQFPTVRACMTPAPLTIGRAQSLATARKLMREHHVRHLPVLDGGVVAGLLSERDLLLVEALDTTNPEQVRAEEAMATDVFTAGPDDPLAPVVENMVERKLGSVVVVENEHVVGVVTTTDALRLLVEILAER
ncbi:MAG TPA: CBS domain-containing protein [Polyangia bacterium]